MAYWNLRWPYISIFVAYIALDAAESRMIILDLYGGGFDTMKVICQYNAIVHFHDDQSGHFLLEWDFV